MRGVEVNTINIEPNWAGLGAHFEGVLVHALRTSGQIRADEDAKAWLDSALETIFYARSLSKEGQE